jgi:hypothetical protein
MDIERVRAKILERPEGCFNLALEDFGLASAIRIIAECAEKRIELGEDADRALDRGGQGVPRNVGRAAQ